MLLIVLIVGLVGTGGDAAVDFALPDARGTAVTLSKVAPGRLKVVAFLGTECPLAKLYAARLDELTRELPDVAIVGIFSNTRDTADRVERFGQEHKLSYKLLVDTGAKVADQLNATRTPEVVLLDADRRVRYQGRIDEQYQIGAARAERGREHLREAIGDLLAVKSTDAPPVVRMPRTEPVGCLIDRPAALAALRAAHATWEQVAPILQQKCVACHRPGQAAPFSLTTRDEAERWFGPIAEAVEARRMPPWHADPRFGKFANDRSLTDAQRATLLAWASSPKSQVPGPKSIEAASTVTSGTLNLGPGTLDVFTPDEVLSIDAPFSVPAQGLVEYQYFVIDPGWKRDRWIEVAEVIPGNRAVLHHATIFLAPPGTDKPAEQGALGSFCFVAWTPGTPPTRFPAGMAKRVPAGWKFVFILHYVTTGKPETDRTQLALKFIPAEKVHHEVATQFLFDPDLSIPPHARDHRVEKTWRADRDMLLLAMFPHMHLRGRSFEYAAEYPDGSRETLLSVPNYDFNWQHRYELAEPKRLPAGTTIRATATYDNSRDNPANPDPAATVVAGQQTTDEMFNAYFDVADAAPRGASRNARLVKTGLLVSLFGITIWWFWLWKRQPLDRKPRG